jgi:transposase-like protein
MDSLTPFKWHHSQAEIIVLCVRWYLRYPLGYRDLEEMMLQRASHVDYSYAGYLSHPLTGFGL